MDFELDKIYNEDCLIGMNRIPDGSVDCVICDLPYGTTVCKWDSVIPFEPLWEQYRRVCKDNAAIVLFGAEPFSSALRMSNIREWRYDWIWEKTKAPNFMFLKKQPMRLHEVISVFYRKMPTYNPQMVRGVPYRDSRTELARRDDAIPTLMGQTKNIPIVNSGTRYPSDVIRFSNVNRDTYHATQKPVDLISYLVRTYTNEGDVVLDNCMGSGTTAIACHNEGRHFIGFELDRGYYEKACERFDRECLGIDRKSVV